MPSLASGTDNIHTDGKHLQQNKTPAPNKPIKTGFVNDTAADS
jgi:hypothetical protein